MRGSVALGRASARLRVELLAGRRALGRRGRGQVVVGSLTRRAAGPGTVAFTVGVSADARRALRRGGRLALVVRVRATPLDGGATRTARAAVTLRSRGASAAATALANPG